jgi:HD-GYP domain-containing protein (c-di-GMP phosphodiesterase class II)
MKISLDKTIRAMSLALDLAEISSMESLDVATKISKNNYAKHTFLHHSTRTTYIAIELGNLLNLKDNIMNRLYISALLHDIGAANSFTKCHTSEVYIKSHCIGGSDILKSFPNIGHISDLSNIILYHHENWDGTGNFGIKGEDIPIESQIIRISDLIESLFKENIPGFMQKESIIKWIKSNECLFSEKIVNALYEVSRKDIFWCNLDNLPYMPFILDNISPTLNIYLNLKEFESISNIFSKIIDNKSKFTATHSREIANLAYKVSKHIGYNEEKCVKMKIAGLLHDIGKLAIPTNILDKAGPLSSEEFSTIKSHAYYTGIILNMIKDIPDISSWSTNHHEKLSGDGYPNNLSSKEISEECRILCVCDIFQALTEDRPYRNGLPEDMAMAILDSMVEDKFICKSAVIHLKNAIEYNEQK